MALVQGIHPHAGTRCAMLKAMSGGAERGGVDPSERPEGFADLLLSLKQRSGLSFSELARRTYTSSSTLHRYCAGRSVPPDYQSVAKIAVECGASDDELNDLLRLWRRSSVTPGPDEAVAPEATGTPVPTAPTGTRPPDSPPAEDEQPRDPLRASPGPDPVDGDPLHADGVAIPPDPDGSRPAASSKPRGRRGYVMAAILTAMVAAATVVTSSTVPDGSVGDSAASPPEPLSAPPWMTDPTPINSELFGVTINSTTGAMPSFRVGAVRFWDSRTRWANLEPRPDEHDWTTLDRLVDGAEQAALPSLFVLGGTPEWAATNSPKTSYADGSRTAPPDDLADWDRFVRALAERYQGRIDAYELWNNASDSKFFSGSVETLVEMTRRASSTIRSIDDNATIVCPSLGGLWEPEGRELLRRFTELGGYGHCDAAGLKLHQRDAADPPETLVQLLLEIDNVMHAAGVHPKLWNTGTTYDLQLQTKLDPARAADYAMRFYLAGMYGREYGLARMYFYNWGSGRLPLVVQAEGAPPTPAGLAVEVLERWLADARIRGCGMGTEISLPENVWQCEFVDGRNRPLTIRWTDSGTALTTAGKGAVSRTDVDGTGKPLRPGDQLTVTETPVLITHAPEV